MWICIGMAMLSMLWLLTAYRRRISLRHTEGYYDTEDSCEAFPPLSIIVYATNNPAGLGSLLTQILEQEYPSSFEVIVVNDGSNEDVDDVVNRFSIGHKNVYQTFVPDEAHNLSRKKLGISLGVKAARYPYVVLTSADCRIPSTDWLHAMALPFSQGKDIVLGFARFDKLKGCMNRFDEAATAVTWISAALHGKPYRGIGYNLAYRRQLFFDAKGFSKSLTLHHGDDDLYIRQIATGNNTAVVLSTGSVLAVDEHNPVAAFRESRLQHCFTGRFLPKGSALFLGFSTLMMWLWVASVAVGIMFALPNAFPACLLLVMIPTLWVPLSLAWQKSGKILGIKLGIAWLPFTMLFRFIRNMRYRALCGRASRRNYTWLQH